MLSNKQREYLAACSRRWNFKIGATGSGKSWLDYAVVIPKRLLALKGEGAAVLLGNTQGRHAPPRPADETGGACLAQRSNFCKHHPRCAAKIG